MQLPIDLKKEEKASELFDQVDIDELHQHDLVRGVKSIDEKDKYFQPRPILLGKSLEKGQ